MSIQRVNKAVEHPINSAPVLEKRKRKKKRKKRTTTVNVYLIKDSKGRWGGGGGGALSQAVGRIGRSSMGV